MKRFSAYVAIIILLALSLPTGATAQIVVKIRPAAPIARIRPACPSPRHVWIGSDYAWRNGQYGWTDGYWAIPANGHRWVEGHWKSRRGGWVWVPGHWKRGW